MVWWTRWHTLLPLSAPTPPSPTTSSSSTLEADVTDDPVVFNIALSDIAILLKPWMKLLVGITTATTTIITAITTNPDSGLPKSCCRLNTPWSFQHRGQWCSYKPLDEPPVKVGKSKKDLEIPYWLWFGPGSPGVDTTYPRSKFSPVVINILTRKVALQSKAAVPVLNGWVIETLNAQSRRSV